MAFHDCAAVCPCEWWLTWLHHYTWLRACVRDVACRDAMDGFHLPGRRPLWRASHLHRSPSVAKRIIVIVIIIIIIIVIVVVIVTRTINVHILLQHTLNDRAPPAKPLNYTSAQTPQFSTF